MSEGPHPSPRWGSEAIDPEGFNIPSLKAKYLLAHVPAAGRVLEVGSGSGKFLRTLAEHRPGLEVYGCDIAPWDPPEGITFRLMTNEIPYEDAMFDAVLVVDVLEHVPDPAATIGEIARVLKPGGRLVAFVPIEGEPHSLYALYRKVLGDDLYVETKHHVNAFTYAEVARLLADRFTIVDNSYIYHWLGHAMDATFFAAARLPQLAKFWWRDNKYYAGDNQKQSPFAFVLNRLLEAGNALAYLESRLLASHKMGVAGLLIEAHLASARPARAPADDLARTTRAV
ncbi:MAG: class I SAM-dependent methyltransferase [Kofleriaceae bacterium]